MRYQICFSLYQKYVDSLGAVRHLCLGEWVLVKTVSGSERPAFICS